MLAQQGAVDRAAAELQAAVDSTDATIFLATLGFASFDEYFKTRRSEGWGYNRIARETGQTRDWVRGCRRRLENVSRRPAADRPPEH